MVSLLSRQGPNRYLSVIVVILLMYGDSESDDDVT